MMEVVMDCSGLRNWLWIAAAGCIALSCGPAPTDRAPDALVQFGVFDVGQGLSQIVRAGTGAIIFDMGPEEGYDRWRTTFAGLGTSRISAIVLSHGHRDHWGGLRMLDTAVAWDGRIVTAPSVDTGVMRDSFPLWKNRLRFTVISAGDTLALPGGGVEIRCIWPPAGGAAAGGGDDAENSGSLVFLIRKGATRALITSDVDTVAMRQIRLRAPEDLKADIMVVPHHGSGGSLDPVFYGYVKPSVSVISYGAGNTYGHPRPEVLVWLSQSGTRILETALDGDCFFESNGYYWVQAGR
jgi:competence protein ComEC